MKLLGPAVQAGTVSSGYNAASRDRITCRICARSVWTGRRHKRRASGDTCPRPGFGSANASSRRHSRRQRSNSGRRNSSQVSSRTGKRVAPRWPIQFFGAIVTLFLFWLLDFIGAHKQLKPGTQASLGLLGMSLLLLGSSLVRGDPAPLWRGLRLDAWASLGFVGVGLLSLLLTFTAKRIKE